MLNRLTAASKKSAKPGVSVHYLGVKFHSDENRKHLHENPAWNLGCRVNYSYYSVLTWSVKSTQSRPKLSLPLELCYSETDLAAINDAKMLYLEKQIYLSIFAHCSKMFIVPLGKTIAFLAAASERHGDISGRIRRSDSCHRAIKGSISPLCAATYSRDQQ